MGYKISYQKKVPDPERVRAISAVKTPTNLQQWQSFLGMVNYYRDHIPGLALLLPKWKNNEIPFGRPALDLKITEIKNALKKAVMNTALTDEGDVFLDTDYSGKGIAGVLSQVQDGKEKPIIFISRSLKGSEVNYSAYHGEALAFVWALRKLRCYLYGRKFTARMDNQGLSWLKSAKEPTRKIARWLDEISEFNFRVLHRKGTKHINADFFSRNLS